MGTWGTGLYSNDIAEDVRDTCKEVFPFVSIDEGNRIIFKEFREIVESEEKDNEYASFWYALADWQWKQGILTEDIRVKAIELLSENAGISDWEESGSRADVKKRISVMQKLKLQLESVMPPHKSFKKNLAKPKHKAGDIIVFRSCSRAEDPDNCIWNQEMVRPPYMFKDKVISSSGDTLCPVFDAHDKYMAILCVGTVKTQHSPYLCDVYDESSMYVYYDYISSEKPSLKDLQTKGFLPQIYYRVKESDAEMTECIGWTYTFTIATESFRVSKQSGITEIDKIYSAKECQRFHNLMAQKKYLTEVMEEFSLYKAFASFWEEKVRMDRLGIPIDTLLSEEVHNPEFLQLKEIDIASKKWSGS